MKQSTTYDKHAADYQTDDDSFGSYSLDDIPEEMEDEHKKQGGNGMHSINEDEEEDLRSSQVQENLSSDKQAYLEASLKDLPQPPEADTQPGDRHYPHPLPLSGTFNMVDGAYNDDPRFVRPELRTVNKARDSPDDANELSGR